MEKIITLLSEIEEKADNILGSTSNKKEHLYNELEEELKLLDDQIMDDTNKKLNVLKSEINQSLYDERNKLIDDCKTHLQKLEDDFTVNHNALVDKVFDAIIGA